MDYSYISVPSQAEGIHIERHEFIISADLGQVTDYTAISILERITKGPGVLGYRQQGEISYHLRHIERPPRGTEYPDIISRIIEIYNSPQLADQQRVVVIDLTGLGRPVWDMMWRTELKRALHAITITSGDAPTVRPRGVYAVPKRDLITNLQIMLQNGTLRIAKGIKEGAALVEEMVNFQTKITDSGHDVYGARSGAHDDIVLSVAMGCWLATSGYMRRPRW